MFMLNYTMPADAVLAPIPSRTVSRTGSSGIAGISSHDPYSFGTVGNAMPLRAAQRPPRSRMASRYVYSEPVPYTREATN